MGLHPALQASSGRRKSRLLTTRPLVPPEDISETAEEDDSDGNSTKWRNVGLGVMGAVLFLLGVAAVVFWWLRKRKRRVTAVELPKESEPDGSRVTVDS